MKKSMLALAVLGSFASVAAAQSSVTLFGIVDLSLRQVKNGSVTTEYMAQDGYNSSRLGFRGVEDLGGGMKAGFWLEGAINPDIGTSGGQSWQRRSTASLMGGFGELRLGRDYTPQFWNTTVYDVFGTNGIGSSLNPATTNLGGATTFVRANNSIGYFLPAMGGLFGQVQVSAGEGVRANKHFSGRIGFAAGPVSIAAAYGETDTANKYKMTNVGASVMMGPAKLAGWFGVNDAGASGKQDVMNIGVSVPVGAAEIRASFTQSNGKGAISTRDATQVAVGGVYNLSKRTALYATYSMLDNKSGASYTVGSGAVAAGKDSTGIEAGLRHSF